MKNNVSKRIISILLTLVLAIGLIPTSFLTAYAAHVCGNCEEWIDGEPYCEYCYECAECCELCIQCGICSDCSGWELCDECSDEQSGPTCVDCAIDQGSHCSDCYECYLKEGLWCEECDRCAKCVEICDGCTSNLGEGYICVECAAEKEAHCPDCGNCYFEVGIWCEECGLCPECSPICDFCSEWEGTILCTDCAIGMELHCPECDECYGNSSGEYCEECGICALCADICSDHMLCVECAVGSGVHCPGCEACDENAPICEDCGEKCLDCADDFCESCNLCSDCETICVGCGACSNCAEICPNCGEYCSDCDDICEDCELCSVCCADIAAFEGCDCTEWLCVENPDWEQHFNNFHNNVEGEHDPRAAGTWSWDENQHWYGCYYCEDPAHYTILSNHNYGQDDRCTVCGHVRNSKIQILEQPRDVKYVYVSSPDEAYDERNIAHMRVKAAGKGELTYTWCRRYYSGGQLSYQPLAEWSDPLPEEVFDEPDLYFVVPTDACCEEIYISCLITDEEGNRVRTAEAVIQARHDYHYFELWKTNEYPFPHVATNAQGHKLQCVGECCEKELTDFRPHEDENYDDKCDVCSREITGIIIRKQPEDYKKAYVTSPNETWDESNFAHFTVEATGKTALTYTWCEKVRSGGQWIYKPLTDPRPGENYNGPTLDILAPTDSCNHEYYYACIITDEEGNQERTQDVLLKAKHNYQYYKYYRSNSTPMPKAVMKRYGHIVQCVGDECEARTKFRLHTDDDMDYGCEGCDYTRKIDTVTLTVTAPKEGALPKYSVVSDSPAYYAAGGTNAANQYRFWLESDNGIDGWRVIDGSHAFVAGKYYKFTVDVVASADREFPVFESQPSLFAVINKHVAVAKKAYNQDPAQYITVEYNFGECNDSIVESVTIEEVTAPVAGEPPRYDWAIRGTGYQMDTAKNAYYDDWMNDRKLYYIKNGIGWFDLTKGDWVYENETFIPGHEYQVNVYLKAENDYRFLNLYEHSAVPSVTVNGSVGAVNEGWSNFAEARVYGSFICQPVETSLVMINDLELPRPGMLPDTEFTTARSSFYRGDPNYGTNGIIWYNSDNTPMMEGDVFTAEEQYKAEIKLIPVKADGFNMCKFVSPATVYMNGKEFTPQNNGWDAIYATANSVYVYYTFKPATNYKLFVGGQVVSGGDATADITLQLIPEGMPEPAYETIVKGNLTNYYFDDVATGKYTLKVTKADHETATYPIDVTSKSVMQVVNLSLKKNYTVTFNTVGGSAVASQTVQAGGKATKPADPTKAGYDLAGWTLSGSAYNFDSPVNGNITLVANWKKLVDSSSVFVDVPAGAWYKEYVDYAVTYKILNGAGNKMNPEANITRAEFVQVLANLSGVDTSDRDVPTGFTDVKRGEWYAPAVKWASENGIAGGMGGGRFAPNESITREQMCTMLVRYIENYLHKELKKTVSKKTFADDAKISDWAKEYVYDCQQAGLVNGITATTFAPAQSANRASIATLMTRFHKNYMK